MADTCHFITTYVCVFVVVVDVVDNPWLSRAGTAVLDLCSNLAHHLHHTHTPLLHRSARHHGAAQRSTDESSRGATTASNRPIYRLRATEDKQQQAQNQAWAVGKEGG